MSILVTGSTGIIGSHLVSELVSRGADVKALVRAMKDADKIGGAAPVQGDLTDPDSMRNALRRIDTLFLLNAVTPDELTQALIALNLAREAGIQRIVYWSVFNADLFVDVPHFAAKGAVEKMIAHLRLPATVLRPCYFFQNDTRLAKPLTEHRIYPMPIGSKGISMVDARDLAAVAALKLIEREQAEQPLPRETIELAGPTAMTGESAAAIWSEVLGRSVAYAGDDLPAFETTLKQAGPGWTAYDMRMMCAAFQQYGMQASATTLNTLVGLLGRPLRTYREFAEETAKAWCNT